LEYRLERQSAVAYGEPTSSGKRPTFRVNAGSTAMKNGSPSVKRKEHLTYELVRNGVLIPHPSNPQLWQFSKDYEFTSASAAGDVINDGNLSAPQYWTNTKTGKSLKEDLAARK